MSGCRPQNGEGYEKRNFETKIITGLLTAGMILSLTACGSSSKGGYGISDLMDADYSVASNEQLHRRRPLMKMASA